MCAARHKVYKVVPRVVMGPADRPTPRSLVMNRPPAWERLERNGKKRKLKYVTIIFDIQYLMLNINNQYLKKGHLLENKLRVTEKLKTETL